jgi:hypothetical protein
LQENDQDLENEASPIDEKEKKQIAQESRDMMKCFREWLYEKLQNTLEKEVKFQK